MQQKRTSFNLSVLLNGSSTAINVVLLLVEGMIASRFVTGSNNGIFLVIISLINFFMVFSDLGFKSGITQRIASAPDDKKSVLANSSITFRLLMISIVSFVLWLTVDLIALFDGFEDIGNYIFFIIPMLFATSMDELMIGILRGFQIHKPLATLQVVKAVLRVGMTALLVLVFDLQLLALIISWTVGLGVASLIAYFSLPIKKQLIIDYESTLGMLNFFRPLILIRIVAFFRIYASNFLLNGVLGPESVAFYGFAQKIPQGVQSLTEAYNSVFYPQITEQRANNENEKANDFLNNSLRILCFLLGGVALFGFIFGEEMMTFLFSDTYAAAGPLFGLILVGLQVQIVNTFIGFALTGAGHPKENSWAITVSTPLMLGLIYLLILILPNGLFGPIVGIIIEAAILNFAFRKIGEKYDFAIDKWQYLKP
ncbi:MAG: oligosaccharide flippase family protein, partial [Chloroflexota bacterium]